MANICAFTWTSVTKGDPARMPAVIELAGAHDTCDELPPSHLTSSRADGLSRSGLPVGPAPKLFCSAVGRFGPIASFAAEQQCAANSRGPAMKLLVMEKPPASHRLPLSLRSNDAVHSERPALGRIASLRIWDMGAKWRPCPTF